MKIYLGQGNNVFALPVNPAKIIVPESSKNEVKTVLNIGDVNIPDVRSLHEISFESHFPFAWASYCAISRGELLKPSDYIDRLIGFKASGQPVQLLFTDDLQNIIKKNNNSSGLFLVESMEYRKQAGEENDYYYKIVLKQYRNFEPRVVTVTMPNNNSNSASTATNSQPRPVPAQSSSTQRTYTVQSGDSLWAIARKYYGDGSQYMKIANANKLSNPSLIYPKQVLVIP